MKSNTIISTILITLFSLVIVSCDNNEDDYISQEQSVSIKWDNWKTQVKSGDNDDDLLPDIPILKGKISNSDGSPSIQVIVELKSLPNYSLKDQAVTDSEGNFTFYEVSMGSYQIVVIQDGKISGTSEILLK